jgi:23S rRNA (cytosine1962-C5)-methyltransferase
MSHQYSKVILKAGKERSLQNFHPWLFSGAINKIEGEVKEGDIVEIYSANNSYLATGHYHKGSITVRIFSFNQIEINYDFWKNSLQRAYNRRKLLGFTYNKETNVYRLINAEGDDLPGLIIDIYNQTAVIQTHILGMYNIREDLSKALQEIYGGKLKAVFDKSAETMSKQGEINAANTYLFGDKGDTMVVENGLKFKIDWEEGQKTGFFIDQRDNRKLLGELAEDKTVLNAFAYSGGFSVYALDGGARLVHSVDSSKKAMMIADLNVRNNFPDEIGGKHRINNQNDNEGENEIADWSDVPAEKHPLSSNDKSQQYLNHECFAEDVFDYLKNMEPIYDLIILDPPAFAKHLSSIDKATIGYRNLNFEALRKMKSGSILFTFSCSQVIDKQLFRKIVFMAATQARKKVRILYQLTQPSDHPISIYHPEGEYLKGLVLLVED